MSLQSNEFIRGMAPQVARRQFTISAGILAAFAIALITVTGASPIQPRYAEPAQVKLTVQAPGSLDMQRADTRRNRTGG